MIVIDWQYKKNYIDIVYKLNPSYISQNPF